MVGAGEGNRTLVCSLGIFSVRLNDALLEPFEVDSFVIDLDVTELVSLRVIRRDAPFCPLLGRLCCKTIFMTKSSNIDSRTNADTQY